MLYLIRSFGRGGKSSLKVGYSANIEDRMFQYRVHNPHIELIAQRQGTQDEELLLQMYLESLGYKEDFLNEWFVDDPKVLEEFHAPLKSRKLEKTIWKKRQELFHPDCFREDNRKRRIYEKLRKDFGSSEFGIDLAWSFRKSKEYYERVKEEIYERLDLGLFP